MVFLGLELLAQELRSFLIEHLCQYLSYDVRANSVKNISLPLLINMKLMIAGILLNKYRHIRIGFEVFLQLKQVLVFSHRESHIYEIELLVQFEGVPTILEDNLLKET